MSTPGTVVDKFRCRPLSGDEELTCKTLVQQHASARIVVMPTHHINSMGNMMGFRFSCSAHLPGKYLPVSRTMFHGHTLVECQVDEQEILRFMSRRDELKVLMTQFLAGIESRCEPAGLDCIPEYSSALTAGGRVESQGLMGVDSKCWTPEVPDRIGFYHAYVRGFNRDVRIHKLFIVCSGGLARAGDEFCNLFVDASNNCTAQEVCDSQEAWWLRKACQRARCRTIHALAEFFGIKVNSLRDIHAHDPSVTMAAYLTDTLEHDLSCTEDDRVTVFNACADTTRHINGVVCCMHPSEGVWLFRGAPRSGCFGSMFGDPKVCGAFPTSVPGVKDQGSILVADGPAVVRLRTQPQKGAHYMCFDEQVFKTFEQMQWNRDNGFIELVPIVVGMP